MAKPTKEKPKRKITQKKRQIQQNQTNQSTNHELIALWRKINQSLYQWRIAAAEAGGKLTRVEWRKKEGFLALAGAFFRGDLDLHSIDAFSFLVFSLAFSSPAASL